MIHHVYANRSNVGDWLSARGIQNLTTTGTVTEHLCDEPFLPQTLPALAHATPEDFIIIGGGGLFMDYFAPFWEGFDAISQRVPFAIWGVGCCAEKRRTSLPAVHRLLDIIPRSRLCVVRDELTRTVLADCHLAPAIPCPALNVVTAPAASGTRRGVLHVDHFNNVGPEVFARMEAMATEFALRTGRPHARANNLISPGDKQALQRILGLYASADVVVSSRLHGCILGLASGCRVVAVSGDLKVESFMTAAGLGAWVCGLDNVSQLPALLERIDEQLPPVAFLHQARDANRTTGRRVQALITAAHVQPDPPGRVAGLHPADRRR